MFTRKELEIIKDLVDQEIDELEKCSEDENVETALDDLELIATKIETRINRKGLVVREGWE